ncbi:histidine phosphatase family protein [Asanoa sp. WMMD1127]|uniref:histidine phosphatase family protein n=1 Tax=Asanoa sp. WMMD1127 TaxID=3016107 RepID=UPI00241654ED|nr:histidine phosphatase family protein [Asanoa sp. WMMD1127]MDG4823256.1 histidine phosphatase family protein [Asanoa sp. WMMD1127]
MTAIEGDRLLLVRHAMPEVDPAVAAEQWHLGPSGRAAARALQPLVPGPAYHVASSEPKAVQTVQELAGRADVTTDPALVEVRRPQTWSDQYRAVARSYVEGASPAGWEPHDQVVRRFDQAVVRHAAAAAQKGRTLVVGTHGMAMTTWLASRYRLQPDPAEFWAALRFPDLIEIDLRNCVVRRLGD